MKCPLLLLCHAFQSLYIPLKGCNGGLPEDAYKYIKEKGGIDTEENYPYEGKEGECRYNPNHKGARVSRFTEVPSGDENALKLAVATQVKYFQFLKYFSRNILLPGTLQCGH